MIEYASDFTTTPKPRRKTMAKEKPVEKVVKKAKYEVVLLTQLMVSAEGQSRKERIESALNSLEGRIAGTFEFKGEIYIALEK